MPRLGRALPHRPIIPKYVLSPQTVTPGVAALTLTSYAPTVVVPRLVTPGVKALVLTAYAPTVLTPVLVVPGVKALTLTRYVPVIGLAVIPGVKALTLTAFAPTVLAPHLATPGVVALTLTGYAPSVGAPRLVIPGVKALALTKYAPVIAWAIIPPVKALALSTFAPSVLAPRLVVPGTTGLAASPFAPTLFTSFAAPVPAFALGPPVPGSPWFARTVSLLPPSTVVPVPGPSVSTLSRAAKKPLIERVPRQDDKERTRRVTEKVSATLNSLFLRSQIVETSPNTFDIRGSAWTAARPPGATDDVTADISVGNAWVNTAAGTIYFCVNNAVGASVWKGPF